MGDGADERCVVAEGDVVSPEVLVVSKHPTGDARQLELQELMESIGFTRVAYTSIIKCRNWEREPTKSDVKVCASNYLQDEIEAVDPELVIVMGNEALLGTLGKSGITKYAGRVYDGPGGYRVVPTLSYSAAVRNPRQMPQLRADLEFAARLSFGDAPGTPKPKLFTADTKDKLRKLKKLLEQTVEAAYDIETTGHDEFDPDAAIVSIAIAGVTESGRKYAAVVPLYHPQSPLRKVWERVLRWLAPSFERVPELSAHNGKFDARWLRRFGVHALVHFDTMLAIHTLDENKPKGLKPAARSRLGVDPWEIETKDLLSTPIRQVLRYNALDAWYTLHLKWTLDKDFEKEPELYKLFRRVMMPANSAYIEAEQRGIWVDRERVATNLHRRRAELAELEDKIYEHLPPVDESWPTTAKGKPAEINFNPSNFLRWLLFEHLELPVIKRGKAKEDGSPGDPSVAEDVMLQLVDKHPIIQMLLDRSVIVKHVQFLTSYDEFMDDNDRLHTSFKLYGTVTGRTSSGKAGDEKLVGNALAKRRGVNIQQVPRDSVVRAVFGAPPGYAFVSADYSQVELRVAAFLAREENMISIYQRDEDIHLATAASVMGKPMSQITKEERKGAKAINFGFLYGMSWAKFILTAREKYQYEFTETEAKAVRKRYFQMYPALHPWHERQRRLVRRHKRVRSPLGRVRHLPDIDSRDRGVQAEAERQAINSPVQSFASDLTLLAMTRIRRRFKAMGLDAHTVGTVHDEINFEIAKRDLSQALPMIKHEMENLPLERLFGLFVDVPMRCDIEMSAFWSRGVELTDEQIFGWNNDLYDELVEAQR